MYKRLARRTRSHARMHVRINTRDSINAKNTCTNARTPHARARMHAKKYLHGLLCIYNLQCFVCGHNPRPAHRVRVALQQVRKEKNKK